MRRRSLGDRGGTTEARARSPLERRCDRARQLLLVGWLLVVGTALVLGERSASWSTVQGLVASGEVGAVRVSGELPANATGYGVVIIHWRHGLLRYQAEVLQIRGAQEDVHEAVATTDVSTVVRTRPSGRLKAMRPGLHVQRDDALPAASVLGRAVPSVVGTAALIMVLAGFALLVAGPAPWRATRWAWFWLLFPPVGSIAFLLLSGPTLGVPSPGDLDRRLRGGWAFLLSLVLAGMLGPSRW